MDDAEIGRVVYHYCDAATALKILQGAKLWATHVSYLNDSSEHSYGINLIRQLVSRYLAENPSDRVAEIVLKRFDELPNWPYYVTSFSVSPDKLSQWRSYADDGRGYAIGFRAWGSGSNIDGPFERVSSPVVYGESGLRDSVQTLLNTYASFKHTWQVVPSNDLKDFSFQSSADFVFDKLIDLAILRKHIGFEEENEWRWFSSYKLETPTLDCIEDQTTEESTQPNDESESIFTSVLNELKLDFQERAKYRSGRFGKTPYIELDFSASKWCVQEVMLGPRTDASVARPMLEALAKDLGYSFTINSSTIPYR